MSKSVRLVCRLLPILAALLVVVGCRKPKIVLDDRLAMDPPAGSIGVGGTPMPDAFPMNGAGGAGGAGVVEDTDGEGWQDDMAPLSDQDSASDVLQPKRWEGVAVYFAYDSAAIGPSEVPKIQALAKHLLANPAYGVIVEGNCDERGSDEYNRALGQQRAIVVRDHLCAEGVEDSRIETVSYGEEKPASPNATGESEHRLNRRAEFLLGPIKK